MPQEGRRLAPGTRLGAFRIDALLGAGGMGEVYRATDTRLGRAVALKVLPDSMASRPDRLARLEREARLLATLNHPHIAAIYGIEEAGGVRALVLELVEGETLADRLHRAGAGLPISEALDIARQIAEALEAAHDKGIVHRDLKPANVALTPGGVVKVLDFGLAKDVAQATSEPSGGPTMTHEGTHAGMILGTAAYMSPEQARGLPVDKRTDVWAFGCVLYELLTGRLPFSGATVTDTLAAILEREPDWHLLPDATPPAVRNLLRRALDKNLAMRLRDIRDARIETLSGVVVPTTPSSRSFRWRYFAVGGVFLAVLSAVVWAVWGPSGRAPAVTLAVLPFENLSGDPDRDYVADGLVEETIAALGQVDPVHLSVIGRTSVMAYKRTRKTLAEIGRELRVDYLVESSVRAEGQRLRITCKLIRAADQVQVWSASYDPEPTSTFALQRELSAAIAEQVRLRLVPERMTGLGRRQTQNAEAFDAYLKGRYFGDQRMPEMNARAIESYERAIALDPDYALAWAALSFTYAASAINSDAQPTVVWPHARDAAARALRANPNLAETQVAAGYVTWLLGWDWKAAEAACRRAISLDASSATAHRTLGHVLSQMGRHEEAASTMRRTRELDPLAPIAHALSSQVAFQARDYTAALEHARRSILIDSQFWIGHLQVAQDYGELGEIDLALEALGDAARLSGGNSKTMALKGYLLAKRGRTQEAREVLSGLEARSLKQYVPPYSMALVQAGLGQRVAVFEWLDRAYAERDVNLMFVTVDPKWDPYRNDPRFVALLERAGFARTTTIAR